MAKNIWRFRRTVILILMLILIPAASFAGNIDGFLTKLASPAEKTVELDFTAEAVRIPQFSETRTEWLNKLLKHIVFRIRSDGKVQEESIEVDGKAVLGSITRTTEEGKETRFSFSDTIYCTEQPQDIIGLLAGTEPEEDDTGYYAGIRNLLPEFYDFFSGLAELFPDQVNESKVSIQYKGYGTAVKRYAITFSDDILSSETMTEYLRREEMSGVRQFLSKIILSGRQRLTLLKDEDGKLMKVNYTGKSGMTGDIIRNTDLDWRCLRSENGYKNVLTLKTPAVSGSDRHNISMIQESVIQQDGTELYQCTVDTDEVKNRNKIRIRLDISLNEKDGKISGTAVKKTTSSGLNELHNYQIEIDCAGDEEYHGSLEIIHELNKIEREHFRLHFASAPCDLPEWENGVSVHATEQELRKIRQKATGVFLRALAELPEEDLQYFIADLPDNWWKQTIQITEKPEDTEEP